MEKIKIKVGCNNFSLKLKEANVGQKISFSHKNFEDRSHTIHKNP